MMNLSYSMVDDILAEITTEDLKIIDNSVEYRKQLLREEYESKQRQLAANWILKKKRVANLEKWRSIKKTEFAAKNRAHRQQVRFQLDKIETIEFYKKLNTEIKLKHANKKTVTNISNLKRTKLAEKRERDLSLYWKIFDAQKLEIAYEKTLIENCKENKVKEKITSTEDVVDDIEQKSSKHHSNTVNIPIANTQHADGVKTFGHAFDRTFVDRMEKFKRNFNTYEQGIEFLEKTQPVWNRMTQCLVEKSSPPVSEFIPEVIYEDENPKLSQDVFTTKEDDTTLLQILFNDTATEMNYNLSDNSVIDMVKRAKSLLDTDATAADVIHLTRCIIEDESDVNTNVGSVVLSLIERSVFEFSKIQIAKRIFSHARKSVDRLQHVNDDDLIPKSMIESKNKKEVASVVLELIVNDEVYGQFDRPTDDEPDYGALVSETAAERMHRVVHGDTKIQSTSSLFPMNERRELLEIIDQTVTSFLDTVNYNIAEFVSTNRVDKFAEVRYVRSKITMMMAYRIGRKLTKLMFGIFPKEERRVYNVEKAYSLFRGLVVDRSPRVVYEYKKRSTKPKKVEIDLSYFQRMLENSNPRNRGTSSKRLVLT